MLLFSWAGSDESGIGQFASDRLGFVLEDQSQESINLRLCFLAAFIVKAATADRLRCQHAWGEKLLVFENTDCLFRPFIGEAATLSQQRVERIP